VRFENDLSRSEGKFVVKRELKVKRKTQNNIWVRLAIMNIRSDRLVFCMRLLKRLFSVASNVIAPLNNILMERRTIKVPYRLIK
jgi:hypothetical protein